MKVVVLGHPRSGTCFAAHCFQRAGWDVGHEYLAPDGISSWMWAVDTPDIYYGDARDGTPLPEIVLHLLRAPAACVSSVAAVENGSEEWRRKWISVQFHRRQLER